MFKKFKDFLSHRKTKNEQALSDIENDACPNHLTPKFEPIFSNYRGRLQNFRNSPMMRSLRKSVLCKFKCEKCKINILPNRCVCIRLDTRDNTKADIFLEDLTKKSAPLYYCLSDKASKKRIKK